MKEIIINHFNDKDIYIISPYALRSIKFFRLNPNSIEKFLDNLNEPLEKISNELIKSNILNIETSKPYSLGSISHYRKFLKVLITYISSKDNNFKTKKNIINENG